MSAENASGRSARRNRFLPLFTLVLGTVLMVGFARTFFFKPLFATPPLDLPLLLHGICGTAWFALLASQAWLVRRGMTARHRALGRQLGLPLALLAVFSALWIVVLTGFDGKPTGSGLPDSTGLFIQIGTMLWFTVLAGLGFAAVKRPDFHKRYMILATIAMLAPAYSRIARMLVEGRPPVDSGFLALPLIAALVVWDMRSLKRIHPVTLWAGFGYLAYISVRLPIARSEVWNQTIAPALFGI